MYIVHSIIVRGITKTFRLETPQKCLTKSQLENTVLGAESLQSGSRHKLQDLGTQQKVHEQLETVSK